MKKTSVKVIAVAILVVTCLSLFAACGALSGTYTGKTDLFGLAGATVDYTFSGNKVKVTATANVLGFEKTSEYEGTYSVAKADNGTQQITFTFEGEDASAYNGTFSFTKGDSAITIGGVTYTKK